MSILITGSIAYDHILKYDGLFADLILKNKLNNLSICFSTYDKKISFGGCASNIAYNLKLLKGDFILYGRVGKDFDEYKKRFNSLKISTKFICVNKNYFTSTAYIATDKKLNQIIFFDGGVSKLNTKANFKNFYKKIKYATISPENKNWMISVMQECQKYKIKYIFDPGQQISTFLKNELLKLVSKSYIFIVNEYEFELFNKMTNLDKNYFIKNKKILIITKGENGSELIENGKIFKINAIKPKQIADPTGCGDAYRAGLVFGLSKNLSLEKSCKIGSKIASKALEAKGTQAHNL
jgi:adenosine kinase